jgi:BASS family bile acid:Na+ symporter
LVTVANYDELIAIDYAHLIGAAALLFLVCFVTGFVLAGPTTGTRKVLAFGTAQRDLSAALLVAIENFPKREIVVILTVFALLGAFVQIPLAIALGRRGPDACEHA